MNQPPATNQVLLGLALVFAALAAAFVLNLWGHTPATPDIPIVAPWVTNTFPSRTNYADLIQQKADLSDFDCYGCHEKKKPPVVKFDTNHNIIVPEEHKTIVMGHGTHNRNNYCYNCHEESNLELVATRDGREHKLSDSPPLCGSCHGPTYRDWEAGVHGRTSGFWQREMGPTDRKPCVSCHNPHSPKFPGRPPAPGPNPLRVTSTSTQPARPTH